MDQIIPAPAPTRTEMGDLSSLTTTQKGSIVGAINEVDADVSTLNSKITSLEPFNKTVSISFPYTATHSGIISFETTRGQASAGTVVVKEVTIMDSDGNAFKFSTVTISAWGSATSCFPVIKGKTYTVTTGDSDIYRPFITYHDET